MKTHFNKLKIIIIFKVIIIIMTVMADDITSLISQVYAINFHYRNYTIIISIV